MNVEDWNDIKMRGILLRPPTRKSSKDEEKVEEVTHTYETRAKSSYEELMKKQIKASTSTLKPKTLLKELQIQEKLLELGPRITIKFETTNYDLEFRITKDCISSLAQINMYLTSTIILATL